MDELDRVAFDAVVRNAPRFGRFIGTGVAIGAGAGLIIGLVLAQLDCRLAAALSRYSWPRALASSARSCPPRSWLASTALVAHP